MNEHEFLRKLQQRAQEQERTLNAVPFPTLFRFVTEWFSYNPWRIIIPFALLLSLLFRASLGVHYTDIILKLFRVL